MIKKQQNTPNIILKANKKTEKVKYNISQTQNNNITNNEYLANIFNIKDFNNNQTHTQNIPSPELNIIKKCGFNSFDEVILRINGLKEYLKLGQKDDARKELTKKRLKKKK